MTAVLKQNKMASSSSKSNSKDNKDFRDRKSKSSDVDSSKEFSGAPNMFANDGSFFEMFQRKMKEMEQASGSVTEQCEQSGPVKSESAHKHGEMDEKRTDQTEKETSEDSKLGSSSLSLQVWFVEATGQIYFGELGSYINHKVINEIDIRY